MIEGNLSTYYWKYSTQSIQQPKKNTSKQDNVITTEWVRVVLIIEDPTVIEHYTWTQISKKWYGCKWTWETIQLDTWTQIKVKEQLVVRKDMDVNDHMRLSNFTLRHKLK
jgi:hypothetical protein